MDVQALEQITELGNCSTELYGTLSADEGRKSISIAQYFKRSTMWT